MIGNRRSLSSHRPSHGKKRVDIVYRSKWITNNFVVGEPLGAGMPTDTRAPSPFRVFYTPFQVRLVRCGPSSVVRSRLSSSRWRFPLPDSIPSTSPWNWRCVSLSGWQKFGFHPFIFLFAIGFWAVFSTAGSSRCSLARTEVKFRSG